MDIKQLIGETTDYEKKIILETRKPKSWCKSVSAFANCFGGKLIFGISNADELVGLADAEGDSETISEAIKTHLNPIPEFKLSFETDGEKTFVVVEVMKGQQTPYYYEGDGQLIAFMRVGNESVPTTPSQLRELVLRGSGESYDSLESRYHFDNMSFTKLKSVYKQRTGNTFEDNDDFTLTLYNLNYCSNYAPQIKENGTQGDTQDDTQGDTQDDTQEKIIKMIRENPRISTADMATKLGIGIATVKRKIKKMHNVSYVGRGYSGHWEIRD